MAHRWSDEDDSRLMDAVEACLPMQQALKGDRSLWWAAVCGKMGLSDVTPDAARTRWQCLRQGDTLKSSEAWDRVSERVEEFEQSLLEEIRDDGASVRSMVVDIHEWMRDVRDGVAFLVRKLGGPKRKD